jgi:hypothetical protein
MAKVKSMPEVARARAADFGGSSLDSPLEETGFEPPIPLLRKLCREPIRDADTISEATLRSGRDDSETRIRGRGGIAGAGAEHPAPINVTTMITGQMTRPRAR